MGLHSICTGVLETFIYSIRLNHHWENLDQIQVLTLSNCCTGHSRHHAEEGHCQVAAGQDVGDRRGTRGQGSRGEGEITQEQKGLIRDKPPMVECKCNAMTRDILSLGCFPDFRLFSIP